MHLKYIKYHNFRPFIGDQTIDLSIPENNSETNTIVILGDNTFGKSTFVLSFIWCFYGESRFQRSEDILNLKVASDLLLHQSETASVEISFQDNGVDYTVNRSQRFTCGDYGLDASPSKAVLTYVTKEGETKKLGAYQNEVLEALNAILPHKLSHFFFFEGEKNNEVKKADLASSVKTLLGLDAYEKMLFHLYGNRTLSSPSSTSVMGDYWAKQASVNNVKVQTELKEKLQFEQRLDEIAARLEEITENIRVYEDQIESMNAKLREAAPSKEKQKNCDFIQKSIAFKNQELKKTYKDFFNLFGTDSYSLFINNFMVKAKERLEQMDIKDKGISGIEGKAIKSLLERGVCLCGTDLKEGTVAYKNVAQYYEFLPPKSLGTIVREVSDDIEKNEEISREFSTKFEELNSRIQLLKNQINEEERQEKEILNEIAKLGSINTDTIEQQLYGNKRRIDELRNEERSLLSERTTVISGIETCERNINLYSHENEMAIKYKRYYNYAEAIYKYVGEFYAQKEKDLIKRLSANVQKLFNNMYSGHRDVYVDDKYNLVMTYKGRNVDDSGGLRVIQYFAYVGGLVNLARELMAEKEENARLGENYPLVLDAAFSHADDKHITSISQELAKSTNQLIFALMSKDWVYAESGLRGKVVRTYELKKIDETEVHIVEVV